MSNSSTKGASKLASVLQKRMSKVAEHKTSVCVETGEILSGYKLKISSIPGQVLDKDEYSVCSTVQQKIPCQNSFPIQPGDRVLIVWTFDGEPVVIDKLVEADKSNARVALDWEKHCDKCHTH